MTAQEQKNQIFRGLYIFDSPFVNDFFDEEDHHTFSCKLKVDNAYGNVKSWLKYATIKKGDYIFDFGRHEGSPLQHVISQDAQYIEYCLRRVDRFYLEEEIIKKIIDDGWVFSPLTIKAYRQKLNDLEAARYIEREWRTLDARLEQRRQDEFDKMDDDWGNYGQWENV